MNNPILFFNTKNSKECDVYSLWELLEMKSSIKTIWKKPFKYYLIENYIVNFKDFLNGKKISEEAMDKVIVFGFKDKDYPIILTNEDKVYVQNKWFDYSGANDIALFFIPKGATLFRDKNWSDKFSIWISFEEKFDFLTGLKLSEEIGKNVFYKIFKINPKGKSKEMIFDEIKNIFNNSIKEFSKIEYHNYDDLVLTMLKLRINKLNMRYE